MRSIVIAGLLVVAGTANAFRASRLRPGTKT
jgi:hypothetical protein